MVQRKVHSRLAALIATCDFSGLEHLPLIPGRSGQEFIIDLFHLEDFAKKHDCFDPEQYSSGPVDFEKSALGTKVPGDAEVAARPMYSSIDAGRLRLVGRGEWQTEEHLDDVLWLPYVEPKVLQHLEPIDYSAGPDLSREDRAEYLSLAKKWSTQGLLALTDAVPFRDSYTRIFNCFKSEQHDRQIGDRRLANAVEYALSGPSKPLPAGFLFTNITVPKGYEVVGCITDRKDFYHQCSATDARAAANVVPFAFRQEEFLDDPALKHLWALKQSKKNERTSRGDQLGKAGVTPFTEDTPVFPCFRSLLQGDHLGVEFALSAHTCLLEAAGVLQDDKTVRGRMPFPEGPDYQALVIDDFASMSVCPSGVQLGCSNAFKDLKKADAAYAEKGVLGSPEKDVCESRHFKAVGAEINSSRRAVALGLTTVGAPIQKRVAMTVLTLRATQLPIITPSLASKLAGNWTSIFMFRRCISCVLAEIYKFGSPSSAAGKEIYKLQRSTAQELVLASILSFVSISDVTAKFPKKVYASDASMSKGAFCSRPVSEQTAKVLWLGGDKKGTYTKLDPPYRELSRALGLDIPDDLECAFDGFPEPQTCIPKHLDFSFDFLEVCAGVGSVSKEVAKLGLKVCTPIELSDSAHFISF